MKYVGLNSLNYFYQKLKSWTNQTFALLNHTHTVSEISDFSESITPLPSVTTDDDGKFLRVVNGVWTSHSITNAEGGEF